MIVLDTNVVSELMRPLPDDGIVAWFARQHASTLRLTAITLAELLYGIARLAAGARRESLAASIDELTTRFADQVLPFDLAAARRYGAIVAGRESAGAPIAALDAQIAAICQVHGAVLATRNVKDFAETGIEIVDPWSMTG
ncbi:MAG: type II toxin-antitoxin system VapC family toxin [Actinobacteria bacterium]|nr:type II toxin-antitoxin system VapC family toxin [Actinomycetota bacterium]